MAFQMDEVWIYHGQHVVSQKGIVAEALGTAEKKIDWSVYLQGPVQIGDAGTFEEVQATLMVGPDTNIQNAQFIAEYSEDSPTGINTEENPNFKYKKPIDSLYIKGHKTQIGSTVQIGNKTQTGLYTLVGNTIQTGSTTQTETCTASNFVGSVSTASGRSSGAKPFDMPHPSKDGYRLRYVCVEGPENGVYFRGKVRNKNVIYLPEYWEDLVDPTTITVQLQPMGAHQNVIVKRVEPTKIHLQAQGGMPINCYYHVFGERQDIERLVVEYEGTSPADYPGDNSKYQIAGYN